jgi:hypothetical protein
MCRFHAEFVAAGAEDDIARIPSFRGRIQEERRLAMIVSARPSRAANSAASTAPEPSVSKMPEVTS